MPRGDAAGIVHSIFAHAITVEVEGCLVGIVASPLAAGPTSVVLAEPVPHDLRQLLACGERVRVGGDELRAGPVTISMRHAVPIEPLPRRAALHPLQLAQRAMVATARVAVLRRQRPSVVDGLAANVLSRFVAAVADPCAGVPHAELDRLIGCGEGLTPACDDFIVGLLAGLASLDVAPARVDALRAAVRDRLARTTVFSAQVLRLATEGAFNEPLDQARDALFCEPAWARASATFDRAAAVGATSGVDALSGLVAALVAAPALTASGDRERNAA